MGNGYKGYLGFKKRESNGYYSHKEIVDRFEHTVTEIIKQLYIIATVLREIRDDKNGSNDT